MAQHETNLEEVIGSTEKMEIFIPGFRVTGDGSLLFEGGKLADETYRVDGQMKLLNLGGSLVLCEAKENMQDDEAGKKRHVK